MSHAAWVRSGPLRRLCRTGISDRKLCSCLKLHLGCTCPVSACPGMSILSCEHLLSSERGPVQVDMSLGTVEPGLEVRTCPDRRTLGRCRTLEQQEMPREGRMRGGGGHQPRGLNRL